MILLSPSKGMDSRSVVNSHLQGTIPENIKLSQTIATHFKNWDYTKFMSEMKISEKLAKEVEAIYQNWTIETNPNAVQAIFAYTGDVYGGLDAASFTSDDLQYANKHLRIISGLYGLLRPSDLIMAYRLEIAYPKEIKEIGKLYNLWKPLVTKQIDNELKSADHQIIFDLTSTEYKKALDFKVLAACKVVEFDFFELKNGKKVFASFNAKRARGLMAKYLIEQKIGSLDEIKNFNLENYRFSENDSSDLKFSFVR